MTMTSLLTSITTTTLHHRGHESFNVLDHVSSAMFTTACHSVLTTAPSVDGFST